MLQSWDKISRSEQFLKIQIYELTSDPFYGPIVHICTMAESDTYVQPLHSLHRN
jgi:hypothetical protein